jgi:hypothetical protein
MDPRHTRIAQIALAAGSGYGFALAGGYAVSAHGMGDRPSGDVDLFTDWHRRADFPAAVDTVIAALRQHGYQVTTVIRDEQFARLLLAEGSAPAGSEPAKLELAADWRAHPPVLLDVGPVLHPEDAVANKMCALFSRAEARDFLDVDAAVQSGRFTRDELLSLAERADSGFSRSVFADALSALDQVTDAAFDLYGIDPSELAAMRGRFAAWRHHLRSADPPA